MDSLLTCNAVCADMGVSSLAGNTCFERVELMAIWEGGNLPADDYIKQVRGVDWCLLSRV